MKSIKKFFLRLFGKKKKKPDSSIYPMF
ncbi:Uncharacterized protein BFW88_24706 [Pseudomonas fluorescens]|nr:Uncharacterized protein BFW86_25671 [Pseudomonas fluorescens]OPA84199.1 Uncharacterized protein BFW88_24706 [Pseudomonas fluorescens]OPB04719.1 Uncharacterized protein BFW92_24646 [Pseudomonas fluorescens]OPB15884.1 Uncharacterized protein BFW93_24671 [Pseudomonas fluorescens]